MVLPTIHCFVCGGEVAPLNRLWHGAFLGTNLLQQTCELRNANTRSLSHYHWWLARLGTSTLSRQGQFIFCLFRTWSSTRPHFCYATFLFTESRLTERAYPESLLALHHLANHHIALHRTTLNQITTTTSNKELNKQTNKCVPIYLRVKFRTSLL